MKIAIASDHGGYELKEYLKEYLTFEKAVCSEGYCHPIELIDLGTYSEESVDYPEYGEKCALMVAKGEVDRGIVVCGTGIGISIAANKVNGIRCALCTDEHMAEMTRKHNDSNMLALGGRTTSKEMATKIIKAWIATEFEGGRHQKRIDLISKIEMNNKK